jgi:HNH endonuclease
MPSYSELLKDPRWQRRRLEILNRSNFSCERCDSSVKTLNVHHRIYRKGAKPWEYEDSELVSLCVECHEAEHRCREQINEAISLLPFDALENIAGFSQGLVHLNRADKSPDTILTVLSIGYAMGMDVATKIDLTDAHELLDHCRRRDDGFFEISARNYFQLLVDRAIKALPG